MIYFKNILVTFRPFLIITFFFAG